MSCGSVSIHLVVLRSQRTSVMFRGFFIQARLIADGSDVGGFLAPEAGQVDQDYQLSNCTPSTVCHTLLYRVRITIICVTDWCYSCEQ